MKRVITAASLLAVFLPLGVAQAMTTSASGSAASATVTFKGSIVASSCVVDTAQNKDVTLPTVTNELFGGQNTTLGDTPFTLKFSHCNAPAGQSYKVTFADSTPGTDHTVLTALRNNAPVTDVGIEVVYGHQTLDFTDNTGVNLAADGTDGGKVELVAKYRQLTTTLPAAGDITAAMRYTVDYK